MRIGKIVAINTDGKRITVDVQVDGDTERGLAVWVPEGIRYTLALGRDVQISELTGTGGEPYAQPGNWMLASQDSDLVALKQDVLDIKSQLEAFGTGVFDIHTHPAPGGTTSAPTQTASISITIKAADRLEATHG